MVKTYLFKSSVTINNFPTGITSSVPGDAIPNTGIKALDTQTFIELFNGTTYDVMRSANGAATTTGTGLLGSGTMIFDGTNWQKILSASAINGSAMATGGVPGVFLYLSDGLNYRPWFAADGNGDGTVGANIASVSMYGINAALGQDRVRVSVDDASILGGIKVLQTAFNFTHQAGANAGANIKTGAGILHSITLNTAIAAATITVYNNTTATGAIIAVISAATFQGTLIYDLAFSVGLSYITVGALDVTFNWR